MTIQQTEFIEEARRIIDAAQQADVELRVIGACAVRIHCPKFGYLLDDLARLFTDIDFIAYGKHRNKVKEILSQLGYSLDPRVHLYYGLDRQIYKDKDEKLIIDVFMDKLDFCHRIDFKGRLELDYPTITLADLFLEKTQIVEINEKDIKDLIVLLVEHEIGRAEKESINVDRISYYLSSDWGFYYTVTTNLGKVKSFLNVYDLDEETRSNVDAKVDHLLKTLEQIPKTRKWKMRERVGTKKTWYKKV